MDGPAVETYRRTGLWHNRVRGVGEDGGFLGTYATRDEAVTAGESESRWRGVEHVISTGPGED